MQEFYHQQQGILVFDSRPSKSVGVLKTWQGVAWFVEVGGEGLGSLVLGVGFGVCRT